MKGQLDWFPHRLNYLLKKSKYFSLRGLNTSQIFVNILSKFFVKDELLPLLCEGKIIAERVSNILKEASGGSEIGI